MKGYLFPFPRQLGSLRQTRLINTDNHSLSKGHDRSVNHFMKSQVLIQKKTNR